MIGAAAAKYLAQAGREVVVIGPDEPAERDSHEGVFGSHYDEGRITRALDADPFWSEVSRASIARYRDIEAASGVAFYTECGAMMAGPAQNAGMAMIDAVRHAAGISAEAFDTAGLAERFPYFHFDEGHTGLYEAKGAGHISPRNLVKAQSILAQKAGALLVDAYATGISETAQGVVIETTAGAVEEQHVVVAAGGFTNMVLPTPTPLAVYARTVAFFEVAEAEAARLSGMPSLVYTDSDGHAPYLLPPIRYPNGKVYLKIGGDPIDHQLETPAEMQAWFQSKGRATVGDFLRARIEHKLPGLAIRAMHTEACVTSFSPHDKAVIEAQSARISLACAGCGRGAKCSDELGRRAAALLAG
jgi:sarcosine oxidase